MTTRLRRIQQVEGGIGKLKDAIVSRGAVFCPCQVARDYHVGFYDAIVTLERAVERGYLTSVQSGRNNERLFVPKSPAESFARRIEAEGAHVVANVDQAYGVLSEAFPEYEIGLPLRDQACTIRERLIEAFLRLQELGCIPASAGESNLNHQGMTMIVEQCFEEREDLICCLRDPTLLRGEDVVVAEDADVSESRPPVAGAAPESSSAYTSRSRLDVFLCHASDDKPRVRDLSASLSDLGYRTWLDEKDLLGGQEWEFEISNAVRSSDVVVVCLSSQAVTKRGYVQKEIRIALDVADQQPEGSIFIIPALLEPTTIPDRLKRFQAVRLFELKGFEGLLRSLRQRETDLAAI